MLAALVEREAARQQRRLDAIGRHPLGAIACDQLERVQGAPRVAVTPGDEEPQCFVVDLEPASVALGVLERPAQDSLNVVFRQRVQHVELAARTQRRVDLERGVLGRRADQHQRPVLDERQEQVLLRLVEAVHLVQEEERALATL